MHYKGWADKLGIAYGSTLCSLQFWFRISWSPLLWLQLQLDYLARSGTSLCDFSSKTMGLNTFSTFLTSGKEYKEIYAASGLAGFYLLPMDGEKPPYSPIDFQVVPLDPKANRSDDQEQDQWVEREKAKSCVVFDASLVFLSTSSAKLAVINQSEYSSLYTNPNTEIRSPSTINSLFPYYGSGYIF